MPASTANRIMPSIAFSRDTTVRRAYVALVIEGSTGAKTLFVATPVAAAPIACTVFLECRSASPTELAVRQDRRHALTIGGIRPTAGDLRPEKANGLLRAMRSVHTAWCDQISTPAENQLRFTVPSTDTVLLPLSLVSTNRP